MANSKAQENAMVLDPKRQMIAKNMAVMPGGPENNNPMNVTDFAAPPIQATSIYGDYGQSYGQMGTGMLDPGMVQRSTVPGSNPMMKGNNQGPYGMQLQPDINGNSPMSDMMESSRLAMNVQQGLPTGNMGYQGMPAVPGGMPGDMQGTSGPPLMPGNPGMVPGSTPVKNKKRGKK